MRGLVSVLTEHLRDSGPCALTHHGDLQLLLEEVSRMSKLFSDPLSVGPRRAVVEFEENGERKRAIGRLVGVGEIDGPPEPIHTHDLVNCAACP